MLNTVAIPLQLILQLAVPGDFGGRNTTLAIGDQIPQQSAVLPPGFIVFPKIGMAYKYFNDTATWNMARKTCIVHGSNLAVIDSFEKARIVQSIRQNNYWGVWVGIHRLFGDTEWNSIKTGLPVPVIPWAEERYESEPKNNCLSLWNDGRGMKALACELVRNFVCEIPI